MIDLAPFKNKTVEFTITNGAKGRGKVKSKVWDVMGLNIEELVIETDGADFHRGALKSVTEIMFSGTTNLIIPSMFGEYEYVEKIIEKVKPDRVIFLGNYFRANSTLASAQNVASWLLENINKPERVYLMGNTDLGLLYDNKTISGGSSFVEEAKKQIFTRLFYVRDRIKLFYYDSEYNIIYTCSGINPNLFNNSIHKINFIEMLKRHQAQALDDAQNESTLTGNYPVWWIDKNMPNGRKDQGGWLGYSWSKLTPLDHYNQVVSSVILDLPAVKYHNEHDKVSGRSFAININCPTKRAYGLIEESELKLFVSEDQETYKVFRHIQL